MRGVNSGDFEIICPARGMRSQPSRPTPPPPSPHLFTGMRKESKLITVMFSPEYANIINNYLYAVNSLSIAH